MYAVVGCDECSHLWIVEGRPETSQCPRCGKRRQHEKRRKFVTTDEEDHAREVRSSMLASRQGHGDAFAELDSFAEMDARVESAGVDEQTYLEGSGVDADPVAQAGERAKRSSGGSASRKETVLAALRELDEPTMADVQVYASERGVPESYTTNALEKLVRAGEVTETHGVYRLL